MSVKTGDVGKRVRLRYADGSTRAEGEMIAHSLAPAVAVRTDDGTVEWWRCDLADVVESSPPDNVLSIRRSKTPCGNGGEHNPDCFDPGCSFVAPDPDPVVET